MPKLCVRIYPTGQVQGEVNGVKGKKCTNYIKVLEELTESRTYDSRYTREFYEQEVVKQTVTATEQVLQTEKEEQRVSCHER